MNDGCRNVRIRLLVTVGERGAGPKRQKGTNRVASKTTIPAMSAEPLERVG